LSFAPHGAAAEDIYKWTDSQGQVHFSTSPRRGADTPAVLPSIQKENFDSRIQQIRDQTPKSCVKHGGIDCKKGPDTDGSILCLDDYRDAVMPFRFACLESRLRVDALAYIGENGLPARLPPDGSAELYQLRLQLTIRNLSDVTAEGVKVVLSPFMPGEELEAEGPATVEPYAVAYYTVPLAGKPVRKGVDGKQRSAYRVQCTNCSEAVTGRKEPR
jgi:hypothetical protein